MPVTEITCPTPGCGRTLNVSRTERGRPSFCCKLADGGCGFTGFMNAGKGVAMWENDPEAAPQHEPGKLRQESPTKDPPKEGGRGFRFPFEEEG